MTLLNLPSQSDDIQEPGNTFIQLSPHMAVEIIAPTDDASDDHADDTAFPFPDDLVFFYRTTIDPTAGTLFHKESLFQFPAVFVLRIQKNLPIPENWITSLQRIKDHYPQRFLYICIHTIDAPSSGTLYIDGKIDCFLELTHTKLFVSHGELLGANILERITKSSCLVGRFQSAVHTAVSDVICDTPATAVVETPAPTVPTSAIVADNVPAPPPAPREPDHPILPRITTSDLDQWFIHGKPLPR